ncbi:hypothetical protein OV079_49420 [Nannocystis pusilla]|uniref:Uncharacterized protein n=1 Tax=Nannocystis pusilla TaxID=889268 RepID=A0A9X3J371_9BACT|nr:hypothetical protein [Nannocystis pusilla]MCY1013421.1 hypothetical protein [Nannocystis pusilla]
MQAVNLDNTEQRDSNAIPQPAVEASTLVQALATCWRAIRARHPNLPDAVILIGAGDEKLVARAVDRPCDGAPQLGLDRGREPQPTR